MEDPWLPLTNDAYVQTHSDTLKEKIVSSLMSTNSNNWDVDLVVDVFNNIYANVIISIPMNKMMNDSWYW